MVHAGLSLNGLVCMALLIEPQRVDTADAVGEDNLQSPTRENSRKTDSDVMTKEKQHRLQAITRWSTLGLYKHGRCSTLVYPDSMLQTFKRPSIIAALTDISFLSSERTRESMNLPNPWDASSDKEQEGGINCFVMKRLFCSIDIYVLIFAEILWNIGSSQLMQLLPQVATDLGETDLRASLLVTVMGVATFGGRLFSFVCDVRQCMSSLMVFTIVTFAGSVPMLLVPFCSTYTAFMMVSCIYGIMYGIQSGNAATAVVDVFNVDLLVQAFGWTMFGDGIGMIIGAPLAGKKLERK